MTDIIVGWEPDTDDKKWQKFTHILQDMLMSVPGIKTDKKHIHFAGTKEEIAEGIEKCAILICKEEVGGTVIGNRTLKAWKNANKQNLRVIMILHDDKRSGGKCKGLMDNGFFDSLFNSDFTRQMICDVIEHPRTAEEAYLYYGLDTSETQEDESVEDTAQDMAQPVADKEIPVKQKKKKPSKEENRQSGQMEHGKTEGMPGKKEAKEKDSHIARPVESGIHPVDNPPKRKEKKKKEPPAREQQTDTRDALSTEGHGNYESYSSDETVSGDMYGEYEPPYEPPYEPSSDDVEDSGVTADNNSFDSFHADEHDIEQFLFHCDEEARSFVKPEPMFSKIDVILENLLDTYTVKSNTMMSNLDSGLTSRDEFEADLWQKITMREDPLTDEEATAIFTLFSRFMWGYDILEPYILDYDISDIKIYEPRIVQIKVQGEKVAAPDCFRSDLHYAAFVNHLARRNHVNIHDNGISRFSDNKSYDEARLRVNISTELLNSNGYPLVHIRKVNNRKFTTAELVEKKMMDLRTAAYIINAVRTGKSIVWCGKGSAGKTTGMNWSIDYLPIHKSGLCIQETDELFSRTHPYIQFQQITTDKDLFGSGLEGSRYDLRALAINGLLTDIDAFMIGEIKGKEALQFTNSANTGNQCFASVHANCPEEALPQIADYAKNDSDYSKADLLKRLQSIGLVVFMKDFQVYSMSEVIGWDEDRKDLIYRRVPINVPYKEHRVSKYLTGQAA